MTFAYHRELTQVAASMNTRTEKHGQDKERGVDVKMTVTLTNHALAMFAPSLMWSLYQRPDSPQGELSDDPDHLTELKHPKMGALKWDIAFENALFVIHHGSSGKQDITFGNAKINQFVIEPKEGGTVVIRYRVQVNPTGAQIEKLSAVLDQEVYVTLDPDAGDDPIDQDDLPYLGGDSNDGYADAPPDIDPPKRSRRGKSQMNLVE